MKKNIFREYDIRGIVGNEFIIEESYRLVQAILTYFKTLPSTSPHIIIGMDGRTHSSVIHAYALSAAYDMGFNIIDVGLCPTPVVYFATHHLTINHALIITASHNTKEYNGIKIWNTSGQQIQQIREIYESMCVSTNTISTQQGSITSYDAITPYIDYLEKQFNHLKNIEIPLLIDCGNGIGGSVIPGLVKRMGWHNAQLIFEDIDGTFPNHVADPTVFEHMKDTIDIVMSSPTIQIGFGLDGDCDRMNPISKNGVLVPGDRMLALFAQDILRQHPGAHVVCDIKSSSVLLDALKEWGGIVHMAPSGHSIIKKAIIEHAALLGGELSCHFFFKDAYFGYDDGIYALLRTIEIIQKSGKSLDILLNALPSKISSAEIRIPCASDEYKTMIVANAKNYFLQRTDIELITIDGIRAQMSHGWGLLRASNTQPVICLRFESDKLEGLLKIKNDFYAILTPYFDNVTLRKMLDI